MTTCSPLDQYTYAKQGSVTHVTTQERDHFLRDTLAKRAFQMCESRKCGPQHQAEHWSSAESEILLPLDCGFLLCDDCIELTTDASRYAGSEIKLCVEPRRLTIYGLERSPRLSGNAASRALRVGDSHPIFRFVDLPVEIEPSKVKARLKHHVLEITLPKAVPATAIRRGERKAA
jgi:hypothetical protein